MHPERPGTDHHPPTTNYQPNCITAHIQRFAETSSAHAAYSIVAREVAQIEALAVAEHVSSRSARMARKQDARQQLVGALARAANTAWVLSRTIPEQRALEAVDTLDVTVANTFASDAAMLAAWKQARRLEKPRPRPRGVRLPATSAPAASPALPEDVAPAAAQETVMPEAPVVTNVTPTKAA